MDNRERQVKDSEKIVAWTLIGILVFIGVVWVQSLIMGL